MKSVTGLRAGAPRIVNFDLPSTSLPLPASLPGNSHFCMVVFLHSTQDPYTSTERNVDLLTLADRKVGQKNLHIVEFIGTPPPPGNGSGDLGHAPGDRGILQDQEIGRPGHRREEFPGHAHVRAAAGDFPGADPPSRPRSSRCVRIRRSKLL